MQIELRIVGLGQGQIDQESRVARLRFDLNISAMLSYNSLNCVETQTCAFAHAFGGEEWFKHTGFDVGGIPGPLSPISTTTQLSSL